MSTTTASVHAKPDECLVTATSKGTHAVRVGDSHLFVYDETGHTTLAALYRWARNLTMQVEGMMLASDDAQESRDVA